MGLYFNIAATRSNIAKKLRSTLPLGCLALSATIASVAHGDERTLCKYDGTQQEMNACAVRDYEVADAALNKRYKEVMSRLIPEEQQSLRSQQRHWLKKRDPLCKSEVKDSEGGSIWPSEYFDCLKTETERRTNEL
jgi:uncharacterized protein YecT (DUF1311 family)